jgi:hypothetical protein
MGSVMVKRILSPDLHVPRSASVAEFTRAFVLSRQKDSKRIKERKPNWKAKMCKEEICTTPFPFLPLNTNELSLRIDPSVVTAAIIHISAGLCPPSNGGIQSQIGLTFLPT